MTRREAIEKHREFWNGIYKYCKNTKDKEQFDGIKIKRTVIKEMAKGEGSIKNNCFLCEYTSEEKGLDCEECPICWNSEENHCNDEGAEYYNFLWSESYEEAAKWAKVIRDLPENYTAFSIIEEIKEKIKGRIKELENSRSMYVMSGITCNTAAVVELKRLLTEIEKLKEED